MEHNRFKSSFSTNIFRSKYAQGANDTWDSLSSRVVDSICGADDQGRKLLCDDDQKQLIQYIAEQKFIPGGRYLYYAGRPAKFYNNCYLLRAEDDTREEWSNVTWRAMSCLMTGGGIGVDYSRLRPSGALLKRTGGLASGPIPLMSAVNEIARNVMQGGSRRSAVYASLDMGHEDIPLFLKAKNWGDKLKQLKQEDFNFPCPLDMTNISVNYNDKWLYGDYPFISAGMRLGEDKMFIIRNPRQDAHLDPIFLENVHQAMMTGEPGFSFNFGDKQNETLRNACTEVTSEDDSDV